MYQSFSTITDKPVLQNGWSFIKDSGDFLKKIENVCNICENSILETEDLVELYPSILHNDTFNGLNNMLQTMKHEAVSTKDLIKMPRFVLQNNYFEFNGDVTEQISEQQLVQSLHGHRCVYLWRNLKSNFYSPEL